MPERDSKFANGPAAEKPDEEIIIKDLDVRLIEELNEKYGENEDASEIPASKRLPFIWKLTAALVFAVFTLFLLGSWLKVFTWPPLHLDKWTSLSKEPGIKELKRAVVHIEARGKTGIPGTARTGTGFNIRPEGIIVTNQHIIKNAASVSVSFPGRGTYYAAEWHASQNLDIAVIKLNRQNLPVVNLEENSLPAPGEEVTIIGNPRGLDRVVVQGNITGYLQLNSSNQRVMVISAPIQPGNSGSPVFNEKGRVVGVIFATLYGRQVEDIRGLAVPVTQVKPYLKKISS